MLYWKNISKNCQMCFYCRHFSKKCAFQKRYLRETLVAMPYDVCFHRKYILSTCNDVYVIFSTKRLFQFIFFHCYWGKHDSEISHFLILGLGFLLVQNQHNLQWNFFSKNIVLRGCVFQIKKVCEKRMSTKKVTAWRNVLLFKKEKPDKYEHLICMCMYV